MEMVAAKVAEKEAKLPRETVLRDFVRYSRRATRGMASEAQVEGRELVGQMVQVGRVTGEEGERLLATLTGRIDRSRTIFESRVDESVRRAVERLGEISTRELSKLAEQTEALEQRLEKLARRIKGG